MEPMHEDHVAAGIRNLTAQEQQEFNLFAQLSPSIKMDGNLWCVLYGENIQTGIAGFGSSPYLAIMDFNANWYREIPVGESKNAPEIFPGTMDALSNIKIR